MYLLHTNFPPSQDFSWLCFKNLRLISGRETWLRLLRKLLNWKKELWQHLQSGTVKKGKAESGGRIIETGSVSGSKILKEKTPMWKRKNSEGRRRWWKKTQEETKSRKHQGPTLVPLPDSGSSWPNLIIDPWLSLPCVPVSVPWLHEKMRKLGENSPWSLWVSHGKGWRLSTVTFSLALY